MAGKTGVDFPRRGTVPPEVENGDLCVGVWRWHEAGWGQKVAGGMGEAIEGDRFQFGDWA